MEKKGLKIVWDTKAKEALKEIFTFIAGDNMNEAEKVIKSILDSTRALAFYPDIHPIDRFKINNDGSYKAYEIYSYRISYKVQTEFIYILRLRHTSRNPFIY
ncbi:MAG: type II toxin-antitoxin system RelE/ParE family toxin [Chitinophagaceae bacterium]|nr:MAG: type II toxin-antitoxin system RelE/ParE family toxin [Chitinophagaceae bacterium]